MRRGFTVVEVLVALSVLTAVAGALAGLQAATLRARAAAEALHAAAMLGTNELALQRVLVDAESGPCRAPALPPVGECDVVRECLPTLLGPCQVVMVRVTIGMPRGAALVVRSVVFPWLEGRP